MHKISVLLSALLLSASSAMAGTVAYIYSDTNNNTGTNVYSTTGNGKVTLVKGSPFATLGYIVGTNGSFFITQGSGWLYSYKVESGGGIGALESQINTQLYTGGDCGPNPSTWGVAELDHTGKYVYNLSEYGSNECAYVQTFEISSKGKLTFEGASESESDNILPPAVTGNNKFAFSTDISARIFIPFSRESSDGVLNAISANEFDPSGCSPTTPLSPDPTEYLAGVVYCSATGAYQVASYTADSHGDLTSTNTSADMPILTEGYNRWSKLDPTGKYLTVPTGNGVQLFHFNKNKPLTPFTPIVGNTGYVQWFGWDSSDHLYAVNASSGKLHTYKVSSSGLKEESDSPTASGLFNSGNPIVVRAE
jgi:hypothetical protein